MAGLAVWNAKGALAADPKRLGGVRVSLLLGASRSEASGVERALLLLPAEVSAGGDVVVRARGGAGQGGPAGAGGRVAVRAGRDLVVRSVQDEAVVRVRERGAGGSLSVGLSGRVSASAWGDRTDLASRWRSVVERTGLRAGAGGFDVEAGGTTRLVGGAIVSAEAAVEAERNRLRTGRLEARALRDEARWRGRRLGASVGWSGRGATVGEDAAGRAQAGGAGREAGRVLPEEGGWSAGVPMALEGGERAARRVRAALVESVVGGIAAAAGLDVAKAAVGSRIEGEENALFVLAIPVALELVDKGIQAYEAWSLAAALKEGRDEEAAEIAAGIAIGLATDGVPGNKLIQIGARKLRKILVRHGWGARAEKITSKAERLAENRLKGRAFEEEMERAISKYADRYAKEIRVKTSSGTRVRLDFMVEKKDGSVVCIECKSSPTTKLTKNKRRRFQRSRAAGLL